jgi:hypothetical protein
LPDSLLSAFRKRQPMYGNLDRFLHDV